MEGFLLEVGVAFTGIAVPGALAYRIGLSVIPAYIVAGVVIGPSPPTSVAGVSLTLVENHEFVEVLAELGVCSFFSFSV